MKRNFSLLILLCLVLSAQSQYWQIAGNVGTNPKIHYVGTKDDVPLFFRINNKFSGEIDSARALTFFGFGAGRHNTGSRNVGIGFKALTTNTSGNDNTATGNKALASNTIGTGNTAYGSEALGSNNTGGSNTAIGSLTMRLNTFGYFNTAIGGAALELSNGCSDNVAIGNSTLRHNTTGSENVAVGVNAMGSNTMGSSNTAMGSAALGFNTGSLGNCNTAIGYYALALTTSSQFNTAVGNDAGRTHNLGWNNTLLGASSDVNADDRYNCIAIGNAAICTANNQARVGNSFTSSIGGYVGWSNISDGRYKKDTSENVKGLEFIMKLRPLTYHLDASGINKKLNGSSNKKIDEFTEKAIAEKEKTLFSGFIAQDVEKAALETGYDFSGLDKPEDENDLYALRYAEFVVPLVKAMQEQQQQLELMKKEIESLKEQNKMLQVLVNKNGAITAYVLKTTPNQ